MFDVLLDNNLPILDDAKIAQRYLKPFDSLKFEIRYILPEDTTKAIDVLILILLVEQNKEIVEDIKGL